MCADNKVVDYAKHELENVLENKIDELMEE